MEGVDLVRMKAYYHEGDDGEVIVEKDIPEQLLEESASESSCWSRLSQR